MKLTYDGVSPFTGELKLLKEYDSQINDVVVLCMDTGYQTYETLWKSGSEKIDRYEETAPVAVVKTKTVTEDGNVWFKPGKIDELGRGLMMPSVDEKGNNIWTVYKTKFITVDDPSYIYSVPVSSSKGLSIQPVGLIKDSLLVFSGDKFMDACDAFIQYCNAGSINI